MQAEESFRRIIIIRLECPLLKALLSQQPYKYNGKELDTERGLNLYDYWLDWWIRFWEGLMMDPLAESRL